MLGLAYYKGDGVPKDYVRALMWMELAASEGDENAIRARDSIAKSMTPADITKVKFLIREWSRTQGEPRARPAQIR